MNFKGHVQGGVVVIDEPTAELLDGTEVEIRVVTPADGACTVPSPLLKYLGAADELPPDASQTIDRHLRGRSEFMRQLEVASQIVQSWPAWKRGHLEQSNRTTNSIPRRVEVAQPNDGQIGATTDKCSDDAPSH